MSRGRHVAPRTVRPGRRLLGRALPLGLVLTLAMGAVAFADQAEGDFAGGGLTRNVAAGEAFSLNADLYLVRQGTAAGTISWSGPSLSGSCSGITGTANPAGFTMPSAWAASTPNGTTSIAFDPSKKSSVTIAGTAGAAGGSCTLTYTASATRAPDESGNPMPPGQSTVAFTINFTAPEPPANTAPTVSNLAGPQAVDENATATHTYSFEVSDPDSGDSWDFVSGYPSCGTGGELVAGSVSTDADGGSFECLFDDGPASPIVAVLVEDEAGADSNEATLAVTVANVAPTAGLTRVGPANVFSGTTVTYNASATDPSDADTTAGFRWSFNGGPLSAERSATAQLTQTYDSCGVYTESVEAEDKDGDLSAAATASVSVFDGDWHGAIKPAMRNLVQKGRVIPVQIRITCDGTPIGGLTPSITLLKGDYVPEVDDSDAEVVVAASVSGADTTGVMRPVDGGYIYNLLIPKDSISGQKYTIRVRPWGSDGAALQAIIEIR